MNQPRSEKTRLDVVDARFEMTCPRLTIGQAGYVVLVAAVVLALVPVVFRQLARFQPTASFRIPYDLSDDYFAYQQLVEHAAKEDSILLVGDSVIWGEYTTPDETLAQQLQIASPAYKFVNGGVNGLHPLAMKGLLDRYGTALSNRRVIVHCNLLWLTSRERDLSVETRLSFNHERLVNQFGRPARFWESNVPSYQADLSKRLSIAVERQLGFRAANRHLREASFHGLDLHAWTLEHPYENPLSRLSLSVAEPSQELRHKERDWQANGIPLTEYEWVALNDSLQWHALLSLVSLLGERGNQVFVLIGPFNNHLLQTASRERHQQLREQVSRRLSEHKIPHLLARVLASDSYGDASHPLEHGYRALAQQIVQSEVFSTWLERGE